MFAFFALFILLDTLSLLKLPSLVFWTVAILFLTYIITQGSIYLYYHRVIRLWRCEERYCQSLVEFYNHLKSDNWSIRHKPSFFMLLFAITVNYGMCRFLCAHCVSLGLMRHSQRISSTRRTKVSIMPRHKTSPFSYCTYTPPPPPPG